MPRGERVRETNEERTSKRKIKEKKNVRKKRKRRKSESELGRRRRRKQMDRARTKKKSERRLHEIRRRHEDLPFLTGQVHASILAMLAANV